MTGLGSCFHTLGKAALLTEAEVVCHLKSLNLEVDINIFFSLILQMFVNM